MESVEVKRTGPPSAVEKLGDNYYRFEVPISRLPDGTWRDFFVIPTTFTSMFVPKMVEFTHSPLAALFPSYDHAIVQNLKLFDNWCAEANAKYAQLVGKTVKQEALEKARNEAERAELREVTERLKKL